MKNILLMLLAFGMLLHIHSCKKDSSSPDPVNNTPTTPGGMVKIAETYIPGAQAKAYIYASEKPFVGYNIFYVSMRDSIDGTVLTDGHFSLNTIMEMEVIKHNGPVEPNENADPDTKLFSTAVVFTMPSNPAARWFLQIGFHNHKIDQEGEVEIEVPVVEANPIKLNQFIAAADDSATLFVSLHMPEKPKVGMNNFSCIVFKKIADGSYLPVNNYTFELSTYMPMMGHGSLDNINPGFATDGHYNGVANLTMNGLWELRFKLFKNNTLISDQVKFEIIF